MPNMIGLPSVNPAEQLVFGCIVDPTLRARIHGTLKGRATLQWFTAFADIRQALESGERPATVVIDLADGTGGLAPGFARNIREDLTGTSIVVCCDLANAPMAALAEAGVHDVIFRGVNDDGHAARTIILGAAIGGAADIALRAMSPSVPLPLRPFMELAVRRARDFQRISAIAEELHITRQTLSRWCREQQSVRPEELLVWARLLLVAALLESTAWTLEVIAAELSYGSPSALRNRIREYTGMTSKEIRAGGLDVVVAAFRDRLVEARVPDKHSLSVS